MAAALSPQGKFKAVDSTGAPLSGGKLYSYEAGTSTPKATYTDSSAAAANANPVVLDSRGEADVWLAAGAYKLVLKDSADTTIWTVDDIEDVLQLVTAKGDLIVGNASASMERLAVGNDGQGLVADSSASGGIAWANPGTTFVLGAKTADYTITTADDFVSFDCTSGALTCTLPSANGVTGRSFFIKKIDSSSNSLTIISASSGAEAIDRDVFSGKYYLHSQDNYVHLMSNGTKWFIIGKDVTQEVSSLVSAGTTWPILSTQWGDLSSITVKEGIWDVGYIARTANTSALSGATSVYFAIGTVTGNDSTGVSTINNSQIIYHPGTASWNMPVSVRTPLTTITSSTVLYLKGYSVVVTNLTYGSRIYARRVY